MRTRALLKEHTRGSGNGELRVVASMAPRKNAAAAAPPLDWPAPLLANVSILSEKELASAKQLLTLDQGHVFKQWQPAGRDDEPKHAFFQQVASLHASYPGGLQAYVAKARRLLAHAVKGENPLAGWSPSVPPTDCGVQLTPGSAEFERYEALGLEAAVGLTFAVPAGGLGERLGYSDVRLSLPSEIASGKSALHVYATHVCALQQLLTTAQPDPEVRSRGLLALGTAVVGDDATASMCVDLDFPPVLAQLQDDPASSTPQRALAAKVLRLVESRAAAASEVAADAALYG